MCSVDDLVCTELQVKIVSCAKIFAYPLMMDVAQNEVLLLNYVNMLLFDKQYKLTVNNVILCVGVCVGVSCLTADFYLFSIHIFSSQCKSSLLAI